MFLPAFNDIKSFQFFLTFVPAANFPFLTCRNCETQRNTLTVFFFAFSLNVQQVFPISILSLSSLCPALFWCCLLGLIAVSLLVFQLRRAVNNKRGKTPQKDTSESSDEVKHHDSTRCKNCHIWTQQPGPLEDLPRATATYQSLQGAHTSSQYYNAGLNRGKI